MLKGGDSDFITGRHEGSLVSQPHELCNNTENEIPMTVAGQQDPANTPLLMDLLPAYH